MICFVYTTQICLYVWDNACDIWGLCASRGVGVARMILKQIPHSLDKEDHQVSWFNPKFISISRAWIESKY